MNRITLSDIACATGVQVFARLNISMRHNTIPSWVWVLPVALASCSTSDRPGAWTGTTETLPSGAIRVTNPTEGVWNAESTWRLVPERVIGELEGDGAYVFTEISGLTVDSAGRLFVLDRQTRELRIFSPSGDHIRTVGRRGEGPGEYSNANGVAWLSADTLVVVDQSGNRYNLLTRAGDFVRSVPRNLPFTAYLFNGGIDGSHIYEIFRVDDGGTRRPALLGVSLRSSTIDAENELAVREEPEPDVSAAGDTILLPDPSVSQPEPFRVTAAQGSMIMGVPFAPRTVNRLDGAGHLWHGHGGRAALYRSTLAGDTLAEILFDWTPYPVTDAEVAEWESGESVQRFREMGGKLEMDRLPKAKAYFDDLILGESGHIWLAIPATPNEMAFAVLDSDGRYLGQLAVAGLERVSYISPVVYGDQLYVVGMDELDVQRIYVYKIER